MSQIPIDLSAKLASLTLEEKISLLCGANFWETVAIPEKGIPALKVSDGPNGARGEAVNGPITAACFPAASSIASTFDVDLARRVGVALGEETKTKGARCLLGPTMCCHRHPLGGRNFESYSEDPFLAGKLAAQTVVGIESAGVSATLKHYAGNEQETQRLSVDEKIGQRALREIYLKPFEFAIKEGKPGAVMTAYNKINGEHCDSSEFLLTQILRKEWGWDGLTMTDWGGLNSTEQALKAGLDLEMPGPSRWRKVDDVLAALKVGKVTESVINDRALNVLRFLERQGCFEDPEIPAERAVNKPEHQALIREAGAKGMVLLKNEGDVLPLTKEKVKGKTIALLGYAKQALAHGGGSAAVNAHYTDTPFDGLTRAFEGSDVKLTYAKGAHTFRQLPLMSENVVGMDGNPGFTLLTFDQGSLESKVVTHGHKTAKYTLTESIDGIPIPTYRPCEVVGTYTPTESGRHYMTLSTLGPGTLIVDGEQIYGQDETCSDIMGFILGGVTVPSVALDLEAGKPYKIQIKTCPPDGTGEDMTIMEGMNGFRLGCMAASKHDKDILTEAVKLAEAADYAVVFTGHDPAWETECQDQHSFELPKNGSQDRLVSAVAASNPNTIVVNSTGVAVAMPWLSEIQGLVQTWFPGQEAGNAIADILTGTQNPEGRLTCSFPKQIEDCAAHGNFPGEYTGRQLHVEYAEGVFVGYRHFDRLTPDKVNFPFGFGLSYTTFDFNNLAVQESGTSVDEFNVSISVSNTGNVKGATPVQVYVGNEKESNENPIKVLAGFQKVSLDVGESKDVSVPVHVRDIASWNEKDHQWVVEEGSYRFSIGKSAADLLASKTVKVAARTFAP